MGRGEKTIWRAAQRTWLPEYSGPPRSSSSAAHCSGEKLLWSRVFMRVHRRGCPGDCRRGSFVESGDLLGSERGTSPSLPRSTRTAAISISLCDCPPSTARARAGLQVPGAACRVAAFESREPGAGWLGRARRRVVGGARKAAEQERACCPLRPARGAAG